MWRAGHVPQIKMKDQFKQEDVKEEIDSEQSEDEMNGNGSDDSEDTEDRGSGYEEDADTKSQAHKRSLIDPEDDESGEPKKKARKLGKELYRPPTFEEMNQLRQTENLFHSNLFRLQIEEMLKEVTVKIKYKNLFDTWFNDFQTFLREMKKTKQFELCDISWLTKSGLKLPISVDVTKFKRTFQFHRPTNVSVIGSYAANCRLGPHFVIDIKIEIPKDCLLHSDFHNQHYLLKRSLYIAHLAHKLKSWEQVKSVNFSWHESDPLKPVVELVPEGDLSDYATIRLMAVGPEDIFRLSQLTPEKANVKSKWFTYSTSEDDVDLPTPRYNRSIAVDLTISQNEQLRMQTLESQKELQDGIMLLKVWLRQRGLDQGYGCFNGFLMSMFVIYLLKKRRITTLMSSYQVVRTTWNYLVQANWTEEGISLAETDSGPSLKDFHLLYEVVFVDVTGHVNLCGNMNKTTFLTIQLEAAQAIKCLDNPSINSFQALFLTPMPFSHQYDHLISFCNYRVLRIAEEKVSCPEWNLDCAGPWLAHDAIISLLKKGLDTRVSHIAMQHQPTPSWPIDKEPPNPRNQLLVLGLVLDPKDAFRLIDKGPAANTPEAKEFHDFWGDKSELRRFRDGSICEAVVWNANGIAQRRLLCRNLVFHLVERHLGVKPSSLLYIADQFDKVLERSEGEEGALAVTQVTDALSRQLMQLEDLPLSISSVQGSAACLRYADPFPPKPVSIPPSKNPEFEKSICVMTSEIRYIRHLSPINLILSLALSSKWPDDLQAIRRIKAAFYVKIAELMSNQLKLSSQAYPEYVDVLKDGFVFRLQVAHAREISLLKQTVNAQGQLRYKDNAASMALERSTVHLPRLTATLHGLHMTYPALGPASCLAKRWVASHMLLDDDLMPEACVELIMAHLFLHPEPYKPAMQPQVAFMRFLELLSDINWASEPFILNFNNEMSRKEVINLENHFRSERSTLPHLIIATPGCRTGTLWTRHAPSLPIASRLHFVAKDSVEIFRSRLIKNPKWDPKVIFRTTLKLFDVVVYLEPTLTRRDEAVDAPVKNQRQAPPHSACGRIPLVGLDLVQCYLRDLREAYNEYALFLYDQHGGPCIGILFKPEVFKPKEFKVSTVAGHEPKPPDSMQFCKKAFLTDLVLMGEGLVTHIKEKENNSVV